KRAHSAARHAREADPRAEVEERLVPLPGTATRGCHVGGPERARKHAPHVRVECSHLGAEREARDGPGGVRADAGQSLQLADLARELPELHDAPRGPQQIEAAAGVAEAP